MRYVTNKAFGTVAALAAASLAASLAWADGSASIADTRTIGYVTTDLHWAFHQTQDVDKDCPEGLAGFGPRETFKELYPNGGPVEKTQLARESLKFFPNDKEMQFPYIYSKATLGVGLNLDGKVGPNDYVSAAGEKGIDNALQKVLACNAQFRRPEGQLQLFGNKFVRTSTWNRTLIEITNVDSLSRSDNVAVTIYRGRDPVLLDATGEGVAAGGTQRVDLRWGKPIIQHLKGKIVDGVLTTEPIKAGIYPWAIYNDVPTLLSWRDMRLQLKLTPEAANGLIAGYMDVESYYTWLTAWSTHHLSYGRLDPAEFYWALRKMADAYPNDKGEMTAISSALTLDMVQAFIAHPDAEAQQLSDAKH
ncbi:MAG: hypothetical protein SXG53_16980 [Pseudomonadota bacterium]|nr:hypothetical protein [Pseudomonadota bacterium]